jgi:hypothetical protein
VTHRGRTAVVVLSLSAVLAACGTYAAGPAETQTRTISAVSAVELESTGDLIVTAGASPSLHITAARNVIDHLTSDVSGDRLTLGTDGSVRRTGTVRYDLVLPAARVVQLSGSGTVQVRAPSALQQVSLPGSGDMRVDGLTTDALTVDLSGSGEVTVAGHATRQQVSVSGSGNYAADGLASEDAQVTISGSGDADIAVSGTLTASISGSGDITYSGDAAVTSSVTGSGSVDHR